MDWRWSIAKLEMGDRWNPKMNRIEKKIILIRVKLKVWEGIQQTHFLPLSNYTLKYVFDLQDIFNIKISKI